MCRDFANMKFNLKSLIFTLESKINPKLDIIVMGTITGAPLLPFCVLVSEVWNVGQGHKPPCGLSRSCQDEQLVQVWWIGAAKWI